MSLLRTLPILGLTVLLFGAACNKAEPARPTPPAPTVAPAPDEQRIEEPPPPPPPEDDCTLATPLKPGIPGSPGHLVVSPRNPNGDSELALLMRHFVDQLREARVLLEAKQAVPKLHPTFRKMRCAWPTRPEERDAAFDGRAVAFLQAVQAYDGKPGQETYNGVIGGCISCHSQSCGGPLDFLDGMKWQ